MYNPPPCLAGLSFLNQPMIIANNFIVRYSRIFWAWAVPNWRICTSTELTQTYLGCVVIVVELELVVLGWISSSSLWLQLTVWSYCVLDLGGHPVAVRWSCSMFFNCEFRKLFRPICPGPEQPLPWWYWGMLCVRSSSCHFHSVNFFLVSIKYSLRSYNCITFGHVSETSHYKI